MYTILVVDDEPLITDSLCAMLAKDPFIRDNCEFYKAYNAYEALFTVENETVDLVLSDVNMPGFDGIAMREKLLAEGRDNAFIFISGYSDFNNLYQAMKMPNTRFLLKSEPDEVIIQAVRELLEQLPKSDGHRTPASDERFVQEVENYLLAHLRDTGCLTAVADHMGVHASYLSRRYKQLAGIGFAKRVCQMKIQRAEELLRGTNMKIYEIGQEVGFVSASAFIYFFKKNTGYTPQQYRNRLYPSSDGDNKK